MNRLTALWIAALAVTVVAGLVILAVGVTPTSARVFAFAGATVIFGGWAVLYVSAVFEEAVIKPRATVATGEEVPATGVPHPAPNPKSEGSGVAAGVALATARQRHPR